MMVAYAKHEPTRTAIAGATLGVAESEESEEISSIQADAPLRRKGIASKDRASGRNE
jgi:hypothetical protein